jgi:hypothetical protein
MNNLNSILIEGTIADEPKKQERNGNPVCIFTIANVLYTKISESPEDETQVQEINYVPVEVWTKGRICINEGHKGQGIRVVGCLRHTINDPHFTVVAEYVEFNPNYVRSIDLPGTIRCDRCKKDITKEFYDLGGNCTECGDDLCESCAGTWDEEGRCESCQKQEAPHGR